MQETTREELRALPSYKKIRAMARALRRCGIEHEVQGRYEHIEIFGTTRLELMDDPKFVQEFQQAIDDALWGHILDDMIQNGMAVTSGVDLDGEVLYEAAEDMVLV